MSTARFVNKGSLIPHDKPRWWTVDSPIEYYSAVADRVIRVESGFETDLASIPRLVRLIVQPYGKERLAAVIHDKLYTGQFCWCDRKLADDIFLEAMTVLGETFTRRWAMYSGVRVGGWKYWNKCETCTTVD